MCFVSAFQKEAFIKKKKNPRKSSEGRGVAGVTRLQCILQYIALLHTMSVFSCWGYRHIKKLGLGCVRKTKKKTKTKIKTQNNKSYIPR